MDGIGDVPGERGFEVGAPLGTAIAFQLSRVVSDSSRTVTVGSCGKLVAESLECS